MALNQTKLAIETLERLARRVARRDDVPTGAQAPLLSIGGGRTGRMPPIGQGLLDAFVRAQELNDVTRMRLGPLSVFVLSDPEHIKQVLLTKHALYEKETRGYRKLRLVLGNGLVTSDGDLWLRQRRIAQPAFARSAIAGFAHQMGTAALDFARSLEGTASRNGTIDFGDAMNSLTLRIAGETLFSTDISGRSSEIGANFKEVLHAFPRLVSAPYPYPEYVPIPRNFRIWVARHKLFQLVDSLIAERRRSGEEVHDLLGMFMASQDEDTGETMTDLQLRDEALTMLGAGHETTANALTFTFYLLSMHPDVARAVEAEVDEVVGDRLPTYEDARRLTYTTQVLYESMRLLPPVWSVGRVPREDDEIGGYTIPKGSYVFLSQWSMHRHPKYWDNPEGFDPDRWAPDRPKPNRFVYFPFSRGQRQCIGDRFAEMEALILIAVLVRRLRFSLLPGYRLALDPSVTLRPAGQMQMTVAPR